MKKYIILILITLISVNGYCQYSKVTFETDSTEVKLVKNSEYRIWEETYKNKDSVFYSVRYIKDTTKIHTEGWFNKKEQYLGKWSEHKIDGTWLYTIDYTNHSWKYNKEEFKYQPFKDAIKTKADTILQGIFGKEFFDNNIAFNFDGHSYIGKWETFDTGTFWMQDKYLDDWTKPVHQKPNSFVIAYAIKLSEHELYTDLLHLDLDSVGNLKGKSLVLEKMNTFKKKKFTITKEKAIQICRQDTLKESDSDYKTYLKFGYRKNTPFTGKFYYEVVQQYDELVDKNCKDDCKIIKFFNVWRFDPWTSKLLFRKHMKRIFKLHRGCLTSTGFIEVKE
ncbi:hypothetical protein [Kordia sp.]|uniref:hypothetical protein n=1 Tax=Kordia sp. TaxID=1965332 RepID=UPI003D6C57B8